MSLNKRLLLLAAGLLLTAMPVRAFDKPSSADYPLLKTCGANLRQIQDAKDQWALDHKKRPTDTPKREELVPTYLKQFPACPAGGKYTIGTVKANPTCSLLAKAHMPRR